MKVHTEECYSFLCSLVCAHLAFLVQTIFKSKNLTQAASILLIIDERQA